MLEQSTSCYKSLGNHNNEIGLPLTLFALEEHHRWAVLEMGMSAPGEIRQLCSIKQTGPGHHYQYRRSSYGDASWLPASDSRRQI